MKYALEDYLFMEDITKDIPQELKDKFGWEVHTTEELREIINAVLDGTY